MRLLVSSASLLAALCIAAPANAGFNASSHYGSAPNPKSPALVDRPKPAMPVSIDHGPGPAFGRDLGEARERIRAARKAGLISRHQARQLRREANVLARHAEVYARDGYSDAERDELATRALYLVDSVHPAASAGSSAE